MESQVKLSRDAIALLRCPTCNSRLQLRGDEVACSEAACGAIFPIVDRIPILIDANKSIFSIDDFLLNKETTLARGRPNAAKRALRAILGEDGFNRLKKTVRKCLPGIDRNLGSRRNFGRLCSLLKERSDQPRVLILGGGILGDGIGALMHDSTIDFVESDVSFGPRTAVILDAHDIPFADESFDGVVAQAVLEHVADPYRCVAEIHRVLKPNGLIYAETPFMQQVHAGRYDFTRFTHLGHRRLFRHFAEIDSGIVCGPGMALAWSYQYFLTSLVTSRALRAGARNLARFTSFYLKYFDGMLVNKGGSFDAASGFYLLGRKAEQAISDRDLIRLYRGLDSI